MQEPALTYTYKESNGIDPLKPIMRLTAIWALSEAALGGLLHALHIPLTGLFIGGSAVIFITLISLFSDKPGSILKATLIVMIVKLLASPHSPINAYFAVAFQGVAGELIFRLISNKRIAALSLGIISLLQSGFQKLIVVTLVFGQSIWEAIDLFSDYVLDQFSINPQIIEEFSLSITIIVVYISIHALGGLLFGLWAPILADNVKKGISNPESQKLIQTNIDANLPGKPKSKRRKIWKKLSYILILMLAISIMILSYFIPVFEESKGMEAFIMIIRSIMIMTIWFYGIGPYSMKKLRHFLMKKESNHKNEVQHILNLLPYFKKIVLQSWKALPGERGIRSIGKFVENLLVHILSVELEDNR